MLSKAVRWRIKNTTTWILRLSDIQSSRRRRESRNRDWKRVSSGEGWRPQTLSNRLMNWKDEDREWTAGFSNVGWLVTLIKVVFIQREGENLDTAYSFTNSFKSIYWVSALSQSQRIWGEQERHCPDLSKFRVFYCEDRLWYHAGINFKTDLYYVCTCT